MVFNLHEVPRVFSPFPGIQLKDFGDVLPDENEQITIRIGGKGNDIARKAWGLYLSNSLNVNLKNQGFKTALVVSYASPEPRLYLNLVERDKMTEFHQYLSEYNSRVVCWLDEWFVAGYPKG